MANPAARTTVMLALAFVPVGARAQPQFNGYLSERMQLTMPSDASLVPTSDLPILQSLSEANIQARFRGMDDKLYIYADVSGFASFAGGYADRDLQTGRLKFVKEHDVAANRPFVVISEAYASYEFTEHLNVTAGKKRVVWGSGQAFNPTDVINPARDPTDPNFQRAGAWLAQLNAPFESFTVSALVAPKALQSAAGIPYTFFMYPGYPTQEHVRNPTVFPDNRDNQPHYAVAARLYALIKQTDLNAWVVYANRFNDNRENVPRLAASFSRYFFEDYEFHGELLAQLGSNRAYATPDCVTSSEAAVACAQSGRPLQTERYSNSMEFMPRMLLGTRTMLKDESILSAEYLYQADGFTPGEFQDNLRLQKRAGTFLRQGGTVPSGTASGASSGSELPLRFSFDPQRRHYLLLSYLKTRILDDWTVQGTCILGMEDLSSTLNAGVTWNAQEWLNLALYGFVPVPSPGRLSSLSREDPMGRAAERLGDGWGNLLPLGARVDDERYGEYDALPFRGRVVAELRAFF
jgi:hypothetical protein